MNFESGETIYDASFYQAITRDQYGRLLPPAQQYHINFEKMKTSTGVKAVIIRAGQANYKDSEFDTSWKNAKAADLLRSAYFFEDEDCDPRSQARLFWDIVKNDPPEGFLAVDLENGSHLDWDKWYQFISELKKVSGFPNEKIFIYTGFYFWSMAFQIKPATLATRQWFALHPLWIAAYCDITKPEIVESVKVPSEWNDTPTLFQHGTPTEGYWAGVWSKEIDKNAWNLQSSITFEKVFRIDDEIIPNPPIKKFPSSILINNHIYRIQSS
jgi:hypothetical protein